MIFTWADAAGDRAATKETIKASLITVSSLVNDRLCTKCRIFCPPRARGGSWAGFSCRHLSPAPLRSRRRKNLLAKPRPASNPRMPPAIKCDSENDNCPNDDLLHVIVPACLLTSVAEKRHHQGTDH